MKLKLKALVAAVALVAAGSANAGVIGGNAATGSSLIFEAWDTNNGVAGGSGMVQSLGQTFQSTLGLSSLNINLDSATFAALLGTDTTGSALNWHVFAINQTDASFSGQGILTTISQRPSAAFGVGTDGTALSSLLVAMGDTAGTGHIGDINAVLTGSATFGTIGNSAAAFAGGTGVGGAYFGNLIGGNSAKVGFGSLDLYNYANDPVNFVPIETKIGGVGAQMNQITLSSSGNVSTLSAVPLPAAVWLFGSGLLGLVGIGRRRKAA